MVIYVAESAKGGSGFNVLTKLTRHYNFLTVAQWTYKCSTLRIANRSTSSGERKTDHEPQRLRPSRFANAPKEAPMRSVGEEIGKGRHFAPKESDYDDDSGRISKGAVPGSMYKSSVDDIAIF